MHMSNSRGYTSNNVCLKCDDNDVYNNDKCFFISTTTITSQNDVVCPSGELVSIKSLATLNFLILQITDTNKYWISGKNNGASFVWKDGSSVDSTLCPSYDTGEASKQCMYFSDTCFAIEKCNENGLSYICEYS